MGTDDQHPPQAESETPSTDDSGEGVQKDGGAPASEKAKDLLRSDRLHRRARLGERLLRQVGGRMWDRPNVAVSKRLYKRFQLDDPWAPPGGKSRKSSLGLGPVSLRFGEKRRQPAPHLKPKQPKKKKHPGEVDPVAKYRRPKPTPKPTQDAPKPAPAAARPPAPKAPTPAPSGPQGKYAITGSSGEFGRTEKRGLVGKLPMRPDLQKGDSPPPKTASRPAAAKRAPSSAPSRPAPSRPAPKPVASAPKNTSRPQPRARQPAAAKGGGGGGGVPLPRPKLPTPKKRRAGRFRMSPTETRSPIIKKVAPPEPVVRQSDAVAPTLEPAAKAKRKPAPEKPIDRSIPKGPIGLDDLFGAMDGGRMRVGRRKKNAEDEDGQE